MLGAGHACRSRRELKRKASGTGVTNFAGNKFAIDGSLFENDLAGGYFFVRTNPAAPGTSA